MSAWLQLVLAGLLEICWAVGLKYTDGFRKPLPSLFVLVTLAGSMFLLASAARTLPIGTAYAVWVGIGAGLTVIWAMVTGDTDVSWMKIVLIAGLIGCVVGLKLVDDAGH